jgi:ribonucleotide monophosphatase NagD (HAD superfamily)
MEYFTQAKDVSITSPSQIAVVGDRLLTDIMMANMMGSYGFWIKDGVTEHKSIVSQPLKLSSWISTEPNECSLPKRKYDCLISY